MQRRFVLTASAALLGTQLLPGNAWAEATIVRFGWLKAPNDMALAKAHGSLEKALGARGVKVEWAGPYPASAPAVEALNAGAIDITVGSSGSMAASLAAGAPVVAFNYQRMSDGAEGILVKKDAPYKSLADLAGKKVAVNRGGTGEYLLVRGLERAGMKLDAIQRVYLGPADGGSAFAQGHVDGWAAWDPFVSLALQQYDARLLADGAAVGSDNAIIMLASRSFVAKEPALLKIVYDVLEAENRWSLGRQDEAGRIWAQTLGLPESMAGTLGRNNAVPTVAIGAAEAVQLKRVADWYVKNGIVPSVPGMDAAMVDLSR